MNGHWLLGVYVGGLLSSIALHWLYQRSAARDQKRWRAEMERCRDEICRLRLADAEREAISNAASWLVALQSADDPRAGECADTLRALLARLGGGA